MCRNCRLFFFFLIFKYIIVRHDGIFLLLLLNHHYYYYYHYNVSVYTVNICLSEKKRINRKTKQKKITKNILNIFT